MIIKLLQPLILLLSLSLILAFIFNYFERQEKAGKILSGIAYGLLAVIAMMTPYDFIPGFIFDSRSVIISLSGFFGGPVTAIPAIMMGAAYRLYLGGAGAIAGALVVVIAGGIGILSYYLKIKYDVKVKVWSLLTFGFVTHFFSIFGLMILPSEVMWKVIKNLSIPFFCIYPFLTVFLGIIIHQIELHFDREVELKDSQKKYEKLYKELKKSEDRFKVLIKKSPLPMVLTDNKQDIVHFNDKFIELFGYTLDDISTAEQWWNLVYPDDSYRMKVEKSWFLAIDKAKEKKTDIEMQEWDIVIKNGTIRKCEFYMVPLEGISLIVMNDITERKIIEEKLEENQRNLELKIEDRTVDLKNAQQKLLQQQKLAAIGQLSGSVAHDIRNPLGIISNSVYFLNQIDKQSLDENINKHINIIGGAIERANNIVLDLLDFSRETTPILSVCSINNELESLFEEINFPENASLQCELDSDILPFEFDPEQIRRALYNILNNAHQAMPTGGIIKVSSTVNEGFIELKINDSGTGISAENIEKVYEPLFTTKSKGVGLGLSTTKAFVESHNGKIEIESIIGEGTTFTIKLPYTIKPQL